MAVNVFNKNFDLFRNSKIHYLTGSGEFLATKQWTKDATGGMGGVPDGELAAPVSHIKAIAGEYDQDAVGNAFFAGRLDVIVGTTDASIVGIGWSTLVTGKIFYFRTWLDEGDILVGPFDYVELNASTADEHMLAYEIIQ